MLNKERESNKIKNWITMPKERFIASGGRKSAMARVFVFKNNNEKSDLIINGVKAADYFSDFMLNKARESLDLADNQYSAVCRVSGGGITGQSEAIRHAIAKALVKADEALKIDLKQKGFLTRNAKMVESKTVGRHKARKSKQWSKR